MKVRKAILNDIEAVMRVVEDAKVLLASEEVDQWQDGFPNKAVLQTDIEAGTSYVFQEADEVVGFCTLSLEEDMGYRQIYEGQWLQKENSYATIHRTAILGSMRNKGFSKIMFEVCESQARANNAVSIRVDTHENNKRMRHIIEKYGYTFCGYIFLASSGKKRVAYEKLL